MNFDIKTKVSEILASEKINEIINNLDYKILNQNSSSPTILIINKNLNTINKIWISPNKEQPENVELLIGERDTKYFEEISNSLEYEAKVYEIIKNKIKDTATMNKPPFVTLFEDYQTVGQSKTKNINIILNSITTLSFVPSNHINLFYFFICMYYYIKDIFNDNKQYDIISMRNYYKNKKITLEQVIQYCSQYNYKYICTYLAGSCSLSEWLERKDINSNEMYDVFGQLIIGIYWLKKFKIQHNDMHTLNIRIDEKTNQIYLFDWDKSYIKNHNNEACGNTPENIKMSNQHENNMCFIGGLCNVFLDDISYDFFRSSQTFFRIYLDSLFKYLDYQLSDEIKASILQLYSTTWFSGGDYTLEKLRYFCSSKNDCLINHDSHLVFDTTQDSHKFLKKIFGDIDVIYIRFKNFVEKENKLKDLPNFKYLVEQKNTIEQEEKYKNTRFAKRTKIENKNEDIIKKQKLNMLDNSKPVFIGKYSTRNNNKQALNEIYKKLLDQEDINSIVEYINLNMKNFSPQTLEDSIFGSQEIKTEKLIEYEIFLIKNCLEDFEKRKSQIINAYNLADVDEKKEDIINSFNTIKPTDAQNNLKKLKTALEKIMGQIEKIMGQIENNNLLLGSLGETANRKDNIVLQNYINEYDNLRKEFNKNLAFLSLYQSYKFETDLNNKLKFLLSIQQQILLHFKRKNIPMPINENSLLEKHTDYTFIVEESKKILKQKYPKVDFANFSFKDPVIAPSYSETPYLQGEKNIFSKFDTTKQTEKNLSISPNDQNYLTEIISLIRKRSDKATYNDYIKLQDFVVSGGNLDS